MGDCPTGYKFTIGSSGGESTINCTPCEYFDGSSASNVATRKDNFKNSDHCVCKSGYIFDEDNNLCVNETSYDCSGVETTTNDYNYDIQGNYMDTVVQTSKSCDGCPNNSSFDSDVNQCLCDMDYYNLNGSCQPCFQNSTTLTTGATACVCKPGYGKLTEFTTIYKDGSHCSICQAGTFKEGSNDSNCQLCDLSLNQYQPSTGQTECLPCGRGSNIYQDQCEACGDGRYQVIPRFSKGSTSQTQYPCQDIPDDFIGTSSNNYGVYTGIAQCVGGSKRTATGNKCECPVDEPYFNTDQNACVPSSFTCTSLNRVPTYSPGYTLGTRLSPLSTSNVNCSGCSPNSSLVSGNCVCNEGYELVGGTCSPCPKGKYKNGSGNEACLNCGGANQYQDEMGQTTCKTCTATVSTSSNDNQSCICASGYEDTSSSPNPDGSGCQITGPVWNEDNMFANVLSDYDNNFTIHQQINSHFNTVLTS